jgi:hypothetical protein
MTSLKQQIRCIERTVEKLKKESKGKHFASITSGEIEKRRKPANDPFISAISYDSSASREARSKPDLEFTTTPLVRRCAFTSGSVPVWSILGTKKILLNVDTRFPRLTDSSGVIGQRDVTLTLQIPNTSCTDELPFMLLLTGDRV